MAAVASSSGSSGTKRFRTLYKKVPGTLYLTPTTLTWNADDRAQEVVRAQQLARVSGMFQSKAGAARTSVKVVFVGDVPVGGLTFVFSGERVKGEAGEGGEGEGPDRALKDRAEVVSLLTSVIAANNERRAAAAAAGREDPEEADMPGGSGAPVPLAATTPAGTPGATAASSPGGSPRSGTPAGPPSKRPRLNPSTSTRAGTPATAGGSGDVPPRNVYDLRKAVLLKHPDLKRLYIDVVLKQEGKVLSEEEFWSGRQHLVQQELLLQSQQPGRSSQLLDDRFGFSTTAPAPASAAGGTGLGVSGGATQGKPRIDEGTTIQTMALTQELIKEIFEEFPIVQRIYAENVGGTKGLTETEFWQRYFNSTLWDRHRASTRTNSTAAGTREEREKHDDLFDRYLEAPDDDIEPRTAPNRSVDMFLDLAATEEDHQETGNTNDYTMQAGKQRATLPLIRRFNEHSNRLVARDEQQRAANGDADDDDLDDARGRLYGEIELDDLRAPRQEETFRLEVREGQEKFGGNRERHGDVLEVFITGKSSEELEELVGQERQTMTDWQPNLPALVSRLPDDHPGAPHGAASTMNTGTVTTAEDYTRRRKLAQAAVRSVTSAIVNANDASADKEPIPDAIMNQVLSCHNAACEFLRQFWSAVLPNVPGALGAPSAQQKADKAKKMIDFLAKTDDKVEGVMISAVSSGMPQPERVKEALSPTMFAVRKAITFYEASRKR